MSNRMKNLVVSVLIAVFATGAGFRASAAEGPEIFWASDPVRPGETLMLAGDGFGKETRIYIARLSDGGIGERPGIPPAVKEWKEVDPIQLSDQSAKFVVPEEWEMGVFACRLVSGGESSGIRLVNAPEVWWTQGDQGTTDKEYADYDFHEKQSTSTPGGWLRVFGKSLSFGGAGTALLRPAEGGEDVRIKSAEGDRFAIRFSLPGGLAKGAYRLFIRNEFGDASSWTEAGRVVVKGSPEWSAKIFNVKDFGAEGVQQSWWMYYAIPNKPEWEDFLKEMDQTAAIKAAIEAAKNNGGGVVYFPRGAYMVSETLDVPRFVTLRGAGRELTSLHWWDRLEALPALIRGTNSFAVEDISIWAFNHHAGIAGDMGDMPGAGDIRIERVNLRLNKWMTVQNWRHYSRVERLPGTVEILDVGKEREKRGRNNPRLGAISLGGRNIRIVDCDIYTTQQSLWIHRVRGGVIARNRLDHGVVQHDMMGGQPWITGSSELIYEDNVINNSGSTINCHSSPIKGHLTYVKGKPNSFNTYMRNIYMARNRYRNNYTNDREGMTFDYHGPPAFYTGPIQSAEGTRVVIPGKVSHAKGQALAVLSGPGQGQYRYILGGKREGDRTIVEIDRPWQIDPDSDSVMAISMLWERFIADGNSMTDVGSALNIWGLGYELIIANNEVTRGGPIHVLAHVKNQGVSPAMRVLVLDNEILEGLGWGAAYMWLRGSHIGFTTIDPGDFLPGGATSFCHVMRGNTLHNNSELIVWGRQRDVIVEGNTVKNANRGIHVSSTIHGKEETGGNYPAGVVVRHNKFENVEKPLLGDGIDAPSNLIVE